MSKEAKRDKKGQFIKGTGGGPGRGKEPTPDDFLRAFAKTFRRLGGVKGLYEFAKSSKTAQKSFYELFLKSIPSGYLETLFKEEQQEKKGPICLIMTPVHWEKNAKLLKEHVEKYEALCREKGIELLPYPELMRTEDAEEEAKRKAWKEWEEGEERSKTEERIKHNLPEDEKEEGN